ncbi:ISXO2-like transposase domain protein [Leptospira santarosai str. CBC1416]|uniref:ISXO2-like transposase domain protein n=1 Tax=Leptospira santarosai str. CBC1416 TaxID=1193059 RepID=M6VNU4_9LEPT|nr:ISXO2-like transposase domain protein [Leptospira santarosai str. CBC1416]
MTRLDQIIKDHLPLQSPVCTDSAYPFLYQIYSNHRSVNHSAKSKDIRYRWAKDRWSKNGISNNVSEGNQRLLKTAFSSYTYIRPENSTRYLNEFSFLKNAQVFGLDVLVCGDGGCWRGNFFSHEFRKPKAVGIRGKRFRFEQFDEHSTHRNSMKERKSPEFYPIVFKGPKRESFQFELLF